MQSVRHSGAGGASQSLVWYSKQQAFNALIHEGTGCTDRVAHDYKSTASKLLGGNNTDRRGAYVYIQRTSAQGVCVVASNMRVNTYTTCMHKYVLLHGHLLLTAHTHAQKSGDKGVACIDSWGGGLSFVLL